MPKRFCATQEGPINALVYDVVDRYHGSISAEHGIGSLKRDKLAHHKSPVALAAMRAIKTALDPHNLLNPDLARAARVTFSSLPFRTLRGAPLLLASSICPSSAWACLTVLLGVAWPAIRADMGQPLAAVGIHHHHDDDLLRGVQLLGRGHYQAPGHGRRRGRQLPGHRLWRWSGFPSRPRSPGWWCWAYRWAWVPVRWTPA